MDDRAKEARREYLREWRRKNPDKVKRTLERYWLKKAEEIRNAQAAAQAAADPGKQGPQNVPQRATEY